MSDRRLSFDFATLIGSTWRLRLRMHERLADMRPDLVPAYIFEVGRDNLIKSLQPIVDVFFAIDNVPGTPLEWWVEGTDIVVALPAPAVVQPWRVMVLLNIVDFASGPFGLDRRLFRAAVLEGPSDYSLEALLAALAQAKAQAAASLQSRFPSDFEIDEYAGSDWPSDPDSYDFSVEIAYEPALSSGEMRLLDEMLMNDELLIAWMGLETSGDAESWTSAGNMVVSSEFVALPDRLRLRVAHPPADPALAIIIAERMLSMRFGRQPGGTSFDISETF